MVDNISVQIKRILLEARLAPFLQQRYDIESEMKINNRLLDEGILNKKDKPQQPLIDALKPVQARIDAWTALLDELPHPVCRVNKCAAKAEHLIWDQDFCAEHAQALTQFLNQLKPSEAQAEQQSAPADSETDEAPANGRVKEKRS
jgi:hypothetical protein